MKLLICTQIVDRTDPVLGFFHAWIQELEGHFDSVEVICLKEGSHALPPHVRVHSLGKEKGYGRIRKMARFLHLIISLRHDYDAVFVHMNPEYVLLGGMLWRLWRKTIGLWYAHGSVTTVLRLAVLVAHHVFTSTPEGCRVRSSKIRIVGQGIDTDRFSPSVDSKDPGASLVTVSRIARSKDIQMVIEVLQILRAQFSTATLSIIGTPLTDDDRAYQIELEHYIHTHGLSDSVRFLGGIPNEQLPEALRSYNFLINAYRNKSLDKAILEAMAAGLMVVSSNAAYCSLIRNASTAHALPHNLCVSERDPHAFAETLETLLTLPGAERGRIGTALRAVVVKEHGITQLMDRIVSWYHSRV